MIVSLQSLRFVFATMIFFIIILLYKLGCQYIILSVEIDSFQDLNFKYINV